MHHKWSYYICWLIGWLGPVFHCDVNLILLGGWEYQVLISVVNSCIWLPFIICGTFVVIPRKLLSSIFNWIRTLSLKLCSKLLKNQRWLYSLPHQINSFFTLTWLNSIVNKLICCLVIVFHTFRLHYVSMLPYSVFFKKNMWDLYYVKLMATCIWFKFWCIVHSSTKQVTMRVTVLPNMRIFSVEEQFVNRTKFLVLGFFGKHRSDCVFNGAVPNIQLVFRNILEGRFIFGVLLTPRG